MNLEQNLLVRGLVRNDLVGRLQRVYVPWDMSDEEIRAKFSKQVDLGLVTKVGAQRNQIPAEGGEVLPERKLMIIDAPPIVQINPLRGPGVNPTNFVSDGLGGPTWIEHIQISNVDTVLAGNFSCVIGVHVSTTKDVGPFSGDRTVFLGRLEDPSPYSSDIQGAGVFGGFDGSGGAGSYFPVPFEWHPRIFVPFKSFYVNVSLLNLSGISAVTASVSFGSAQIYEGEEFGLRAVQPRFVQKAIPPFKAPVRAAVVVPRVVPTYSAEQKIAEPVVKIIKEPAPVKAALVTVTEERRYKNYAAIKVDEGGGVKIIWSTLHNTGEGGWGMPLAVTVTYKK